MKSDKEIKEFIKRVKQGLPDDETIGRDIVVTLLEEVLEIRKCLNKPVCKCKTDPTKLKKGDILIGGKE